MSMTRLTQNGACCSKKLINAHLFAQLGVVLEHLLANSTGLQGHTIAAQVMQSSASVFEVVTAFMTGTKSSMMKVEGSVQSSYKAKHT